MSEVQQPIPAPAADPTRTGRDALQRHAWAEAFDLLSAADRAGTLGGDDLESLALAAFFSAKADVELEVKLETPESIHPAPDAFTMIGPFILVKVACPLTTSIELVRFINVPACSCAVPPKTEPVPNKIPFTKLV